MKILYRNEWVDFYPIRRPVGPFETEDHRPLHQLDDEVYGKFIAGMVGYSPAWMYKTVRKTEIRE